MSKGYLKLLFEENQKKINDERTSKVYRKYLIEENKQIMKEIGEK